jgi:hypothetical protein
MDQQSLVFLLKFYRKVSYGFIFQYGLSELQIKFNFIMGALLPYSFLDASKQIMVY